MAHSAKVSQLSVTGSRFNGPSNSSTSSSTSVTPISEPGSEPKSFVTPTSWNEAVEEAYRLITYSRFLLYNVYYTYFYIPGSVCIICRFQVAGYRDEREYRAVRGSHAPLDRWPANGYVKKLQRRDGCFYYFDQRRELIDRDVGKYRIYQY